MASLTPGQAGAAGTGADGTPRYRCFMQRVGVLVFECTRLFEFAVAREIWGVDRSRCGIPAFEFLVAGSAAWPGHGPGRIDDVRELATCNLVVVPGIEDPSADIPEPVAAALRQAHHAGATLASLCSGTFVLAAAGLLDGRKATAHWMDVDDLAARYPGIRVTADSLYVQDGNIWTSAGTAASIDMFLALLRTTHGATVAARVANTMLVAPLRAAGLPQPPPPSFPAIIRDDRASEDSYVRQAVLDTLSHPWTVREMAARAGISERAFTRRFTADNGTTPLQWLIGQRVLAAQQLLEATDLPVAAIARHCGFSTAVSLRTHFSRHVGRTPRDYRADYRRKRL
jgi:transcriptional regulator GlxA family with amidase domain